MMSTPPKGLPTLIWLSSSIEEIPLPVKLSLMFDTKGNSFLATKFLVNKQYHALRTSYVIHHEMFANFCN